jgi:Tfp pilus assembly protein PilN
VIQINLLPNVESRRSPRGGIAAALRIPNVPGVVGDPWTVGLSIAGVLVALFAGWSLWSTASATTRLEAQIAQAVTDSTRHATTIALIQSLTERQDTIREKIDIIRSVDTRRYVWPRLMDEIGISVPVFTWLTRLSSAEAQEVGAGPTLTLEGASGSTQALTRFMKNLEASPFIRDVTLVTTEQVASEGRTYNRFTLEARYELPDSAFFETVPIVVLTN